jgi:hypothetical protein
MKRTIRLQRWHALPFTLVALTALYVGLARAPAATQGTPARHSIEKTAISAQCWLQMPAPFSNLALFGGGASAARGASGDPTREPDHGLAEEVPASASGKGGKGFRATVPVWFHVVHDGPIANLTQEQIDAQIAVLNRTFAGREGGYDTGFRFKLVGVTRTDNGEWLRHGFGDKAERDMKRSLHRGGRDTLNIYATEASIYLGWAYFPNLSDARLYLDGIVVDWESMLGTSTRYAGRYDLGKTTVHEAGHWINLYHVFQGGCNNWGDYVEDTPPQRTATNGCPEGQDSCAEPGIDSIHNYMDYSYDSCYNQFTAGQAARMQDAWLYFRASG